MMKKHILWLSDVPWANSGLGIQSKFVINYFVKQGYNVSCIAWYAGTYGESTTYQIAGHAMPVWFLGTKSFGNTAQICSLLNKIQPDIIISQGDLHMVNALLDMPDVWKQKWAHWWTIDIEKFTPPVLQSLQQIPCIIALTQFGANAMLANTGRHVPIVGQISQVVSPSKMPYNNCRESMGFTDDDVIFGCVARNIWRKNLHTLLRSFALVAQQCPKMKILLHTDTSDTTYGGCDIKQIVNELRLKNRVFISDSAINTNDLTLVYDLMNFHVLPTYAEGFGVPVVESMSRGIPNIVPQNTTMPELVQNSGYIVPLAINGNIHPLSHQEMFSPCPYKLAEILKDAYNLFLENHAQYQELSNRALQLSQSYSENKILPEWDKIIAGFAQLPRFWPESAHRKLLTPALTFERAQKKALLCTLYYPPNVCGGGEYTAHELMKGLKHNNWDVRVLTLRQSSVHGADKWLPETELIHDGIKVLQAGERWCEYLENLLTTDPPDVVITYEIHSWYSLRFVQLAKKYNIKTVVYEQYWRCLSGDYEDIATQPASPPWQGLEIKKLTDQIIVNSEFSQQMFRKHLDVHAEIVYPPINLLRDAQNNVDQINENEQYITMIAPSQAKGVDTVFFLAQALPTEKFKLVGGIGDTNTHLNIQKYSNIIYQSHTEDMAAVYKNAKIVLFPSLLDESFGRVPVEALAFGVPVLARDTGAVRGVLGACGVILPKNASNQEWLDALLSLLQNIDVTKQKAQKDRLAILAKFNPKSQCAEFTRILESLIQSPNITATAQEQCDILYICDERTGYAGVRCAAQNLAHCFSNTLKVIEIAPWLNNDALFDVMHAIDTCHARAIIYGGWNNAYADILHKIRELRPGIRHILHWHSPLAQIEMGNEIELFMQCNDMLAKGYLQYIAVPFQKDAEIFRHSYHANYRWLPNTVYPIQNNPLLLNPKDFKIGFFAAPSARKNILSQLSAVRLLNLALIERKGTLPWERVVLYIGNNFKEHAEYYRFLKMLNIPHQLLPHLKNKQLYYDYLGAMNLNMQVTFSEAFNYVCAESLALGIPCLGSLMTPALTSHIPELQEMLTKFLLIPYIDSAAYLFDKMKTHLEMPQALSHEMRIIWQTHIQTLSTYHNDIISKAFAEFLRTPTS